MARTRRCRTQRNRRAWIQALEARLLMSSSVAGTGFEASPPVPVANSAGSVAARTVHSAPPSPLSAVPQLDSNLSANVKLYLDFIGAPATPWQSYNVTTTPAYDIDSDPTTFSATELANIREIWARVSEKYSPFNIDVTTIDVGTPTHGQSLKVIIGGDGAWTGGTYGGLSYVGAFASRSLPDSSYVFPDNIAAGDPHDVAEAAAHEAGHAFGLSHQSVYNGNTLANAYNPGNANTAPIMGDSYSATRGLWWNGASSNGPNSIQDDLSIISGSSNGFGYRPQDHGQTIAAANAMTAIGTSVSGSGVIEATSDADYFSFSTGAGSISLQVAVAQYGPMLHAKAQLFDSNGNLLLTAANFSTLSQSISTTVPAGTYYVAVESYGSYGDIGQYTVSGTIAVAPATVAISGNASVNEGSTYTLSLSASHPGHTISGWSIDWGDGTVDAITGNSTSATHVYTDGPNTFTINASATDDASTYSATSKTVTVVNVAPTIGISGSTSSIDGSTYSLTLGAVADPGHDTVAQFIVHWGDGQSDTYTSAGAKTHTFAGGAGVHAVTVDLVDGDGTYTNATTQPLSVTISEPAPVDTTPPSATFSAADVTSATSPLQFTVTYTDAVAVERSSLGNSNIIVTAPGGATFPATLLSVDSTVDAPTLHATYIVGPPAGGWQLADNGTYTVSLLGNQVADSSNNTMPAGTLGTVAVNVVPPATEIGTVTTRQVKRTLAAVLSSQGQQMFYKVTLAQTTKLTLALSGQRDILTLDVLDEAGGIVFTRSSKKAISSAATLTPGVYYVRVTLTGARLNRFKLGATAKPIVMAKKTKTPRVKAPSVSFKPSIRSVTGF